MMQEQSLPSMNGGKLNQDGEGRARKKRAHVPAAQQLSRVLTSTACWAGVALRGDSQLPPSLSSTRELSSG